MNPYWGADCFSFFWILVSRLFSLKAFHSPVADEIQMGTLICVAIACGFLGPFLFVRKMGMFANALSHTTLLGISLAAMIFGGGVLFDLPRLLVAALFSSLLTAVCTEGLIRWLRLQADASLGLVFTFFFALGILFVSLYTRDLHLGHEAIMGNVDALSWKDLRLSFLLVLFNGIFFSWFFRPLQLTSFDPGLARTLGVRVGFYRFALLFFTSLTAIGAFRAVGALLVLSFLLGPPLISRLFFHKMKTILICSALIGIGASCIGVALSRHFLSIFDLPLSTGGIVSCLIGIFYFLSVGLIYFFHAKRRSVTMKGSSEK